MVDKNDVEGGGGGVGVGRRSRGELGDEAIGEGRQRVGDKVVEGTYDPGEGYTVC